MWKVDPLSDDSKITKEEEDIEKKLLNRTRQKKLASSRALNLNRSSRVLRNQAERLRLNWRDRMKTKRNLLLHLIPHLNPLQKAKLKQLKKNLIPMTRTLLLKKANQVRSRSDDTDVREEPGK
jgi:hypothetical protein